MPRYELITKSGFAAPAWRRVDRYAFASTDAVTPLVVQGLAEGFVSAHTEGSVRQGGVISQMA